MTTLNYIGSKKSLLNFIQFVIDENIKIKKKMTFGDLFAGTNVVGKYFFDKYRESKKIKIISNDMEKYSSIIGKAYLKCSYSKKLENVIEKLNSLQGIKGIVYENYSPGGEKKRMFWTEENSMIIDSIRQEIQQLFDTKNINQNEYNFLIASLLISADKVSNVASVYGAYLKKFKKTSVKKLVLIPIHKDIISYKSINRNKVFNQDINDITELIKYDIVYLDPPYNNRQYSANYFPLNYIVEYDKNIKLRGKTGIIQNNNISKFCKKRNVEEEVDKLINNLKTKYILLSYNNEGLLSHDTLIKILSKYGDVKIYKTKYKKFINSKKENITENEKKKIFEYIFYLKKYNIY